MMTVATMCVIAIIDTGVNCTMLNCLQGYNNTNHGNGHGTLVAQIAQQTAPDCKILPVKVYSNGIVPLDELEKGLSWVKRWKRKHQKASLVVNMSMQIRSPLPRGIKRQLRFLKQLDVPIVVASGNGGTNTLNRATSISVGALNATGSVESWSNSGDVYVFAQQFTGQKFSRGTSYAAPTISAILAKVG